MHFECLFLLYKILSFYIKIISTPLLGSSHLHSLIFVILWKYVDGPHPGVTERALSYVLVLIHWAIKYAEKNADDEQDTEGVAELTSFWKFFENDDILENSRQKVDLSNFKDNGEEELGANQSESIISILVRIHMHLNGGRLKFVLGQQVSSVPRISNLIARILNLFAESDEQCKNAIIRLIDELNPKEESVEDQRAEMRRKAKERQRQMMEKLKEQQNKFKKKNEEQLKEIDEVQDDRPLCCVCRQPSEPGKELGKFFSNLKCVECFQLMLFSMLAIGTPVSKYILICFEVICV